MPPDAASPDILTPRVLAAVLALSGLLALMAAPAPSWSSIGIALACLAGFCILWLFPTRRSAGRATRRTTRLINAADARRPFRRG